MSIFNKPDSWLKPDEKTECDGECEPICDDCICELLGGDVMGG